MNSLLKIIFHYVSDPIIDLNEFHHKHKVSGPGEMTGTCDTMTHDKQPAVSILGSVKLYGFKWLCCEDILYRKFISIVFFILWMAI